MAIKRNKSGGNKSAAITLLENRVEELEEQLAEYQDFANRVNRLSSDYSDELDDEDYDDENFDDEDSDDEETEK